MAEDGTVELERVLLVGDGDKVTVGNPVVEGARVIATAKENGKSDKVIVFKYKPKVRYRRKNGHRQLYTRLSIDSITVPGMEKAKPAKASKPARATRAAKTPKAAATAKPATARMTTRRKKKEETADGA